MITGIGRTAIQTGRRWWEVEFPRHFVRPQRSITATCSECGKSWWTDRHAKNGTKHPGCRVSPPGRLRGI